MGTDNYSVFYLKKKAIFSIPVKPRNLKINAYKYFPGSTKKKEIFRFGVKIATRLNLERLISCSMATPTPMYKSFNFQEWKSNIKERLVVNDIFTVVSFPSSDSRKRFYVHLFDEEGVNVAFAKVSRDTVNDLFLEDEKRNIENLINKDFTFKVPKIISAEIYNDHQFVLYEPMPSDSIVKNSNWEDYGEKISQELRKNTLVSTELNETTWVERFLKTLSEKATKEYLEANELIKDSAINVCFSHGDLHNGNIRHYKDEVWVFDWESGCEDAPIMTDEISFYLGTIQRLFTRSPELVHQDIYNKFINGKSDKYIRDVGLAFAFLCTMDRQDAKNIVMNWKSIKSGFQ